MLLEMIEEQQAKDGNDSDGEDDQKNVSDDESNLEQEAEGSCKEQAQVRKSYNSLVLLILRKLTLEYCMDYIIFKIWKANLPHLQCVWK